MKKDLARREFLRKMGLLAVAIPVAPYVLDKIAASVLEKAYAGTASTGTDALYVNFAFPGGPPRWMCDLPLTPMGKSATNFKPSYFGTLFETVNGLSLPTYEASAVKIGAKTYYLPPVWNMDLAKYNLSDLLSQAMMIRGQDNLIDAHLLAGRAVVAPIFGGASLHGSAADSATTPIPSIIDNSNGVWPSQAYHSAKDLVAADLDYSGNPIANLLSAYKNWYANRLVHSHDARLLQAQSLSAFDDYANASGITTSTLSKMYDNAIQLVDENVYAAKSGLWTDTYKKYLAIVTEAVQPVKGTLPGFWDKPIKVGTKNPAYTFEYSSSTYVELADLRDMISSATTVPRMAENFAIAELTLDTLTSSLGLAFPGLSGLSIATTGEKQDATHDQHQIGFGTSTIVTTLFYRAFLGCMSEFTARLKANGSFDRAVLHVASEFSRLPADPYGSAHGASGSNTLLISGKLEKFAVIGNVNIDSPRGTYGVAAPYAVGKAGSTGQTIQPKDVALTVSTMLNIAPVTTNGTCLVTLQNGKWIPRWEEALNV